MVSATYSSVAALVVAAAVAAGVDAGALSTGVCYAPWHHSSVDTSVIASDFSIVGTYFQRIRTFQTLFGSVNAIEAAASAGLKIAAGVQMTDASLIQTEIDAVCSAVQTHASAVEAVYVGNENLKNADGSFGSFPADALVGYINQVKACVSSYGIPVGTVQRINEWLETDNAAALKGASDVIGVNIYPFFTNGDDSAVTKLEKQYQQLIDVGYDASTLHVTETGWPYAGSTYQGNTPSYEGMQQYINDFATWSQSKGSAYFFMMFDTTTSYSGQDYETHFGLFGSDTTTQHVTIPSGSGGNTTTTTTTTTSETAAPTPSETAAPTPSETAAPTPSETAAPTPSETAAPTPSETAAPTPSETTAPTTGSTTGSTTASNTDDYSDDSASYDETDDSTTGDASSEAPVVTPAPTTAGDSPSTTGDVTQETPVATTATVSSKDCKM